MSWTPESTETHLCIVKRLNRDLPKLKAKGHIRKTIYNKILSVSAQSVRLYRLTKIYKNTSNPPYRPILSMPNTYCTNLAKWLDIILKPYLPPDFTIKDSFSFASEINQLSLPNTYHMVSFDVCSLFTNIPVSETIDFICNLIPEGELPILKTTLKKLLNFACKNIAFSFNKQMYVQHEGMCMGSNLYPTTVVFYMHMLEVKMQFFSNQPVFHRRCVENICFC